MTNYCQKCLDSFPIRVQVSSYEVLGIKVVSESECEFPSHKALNEEIAHRDPVRFTKDIGGKTG